MKSWLLILLETEIHICAMILTQNEVEIHCSPGFLTLPIRGAREGPNLNWMPEPDFAAAAQDQTLIATTALDWRPHRTLGFHCLVW